jgi:hypothetical protein
MFCQNGFRHDSAHTSGLDQPDHRRDEMDYKNNQIAHEEWYSGPQTTEVGANLEFATDTMKVATISHTKGGSGPRLHF